MGVLFTLIGLPGAIIGLWMFHWMLLFFGVLWLLGACLLLEVQNYWKVTRESKIEWPAMWCGLLASLMGAFIIFISMGGDPDDSHFHAPRVVAGLAGGAFFLAGVMVIRLEALGPKVLTESDVITSNRNRADDYLLCCSRHMGRVWTGRQDRRGFCQRPVRLVSLSIGQLVYAHCLLSRRTDTSLTGKRLLDRCRQTLAESSKNGGLRERASRKRISCKKDISS